METRKLEQLESNPLNPRGAIVSDAALEELAASIKAVGLLQPLIITPENVVIAGHRRLYAARLAGMLQVPVIVKDIPEVQQIGIMLVENIQRQSLNPAEEGLAYLSLMNRGLSVSKICKAVGVCPNTVNVRVAIARLPPEARAPFAQGVLPVYCVEVLEGLDSAEQIRWTGRAVRENWTGARLCSEVRQATRPRSYTPPTPQETRERIMDSAIRKLYEITDALEEHNAPRPALLKLADGIRELELDVKRKRNAA